MPIREAALPALSALLTVNDFEVEMPLGVVSILTPFAAEPAQLATPDPGSEHE